MIPCLRATARIGLTKRKEIRNEKRAMYSHLSPSCANQFLTGEQKEDEDGKDGQRITESPQGNGHQL